MTAPLPELVPLFPLPGTALFPGMPLPLHVFEPRYRSMVEDARAGGRVIGMVLLKPGWEDRYLGRPEVYPVGCAGHLQACEALPDGRFNIVLSGLARFRILEERHGRPYRLARVAELPEDAAGADELKAARAALVEDVARVADVSGVAVAQPELPDDVFVNALCQSLPLDPLELQSLLDCSGPLERCRRLRGLIEFRLLERAAYGREGSDLRH